MLLDFFVDVMRRGTELSTELLDLKKNLRNFLGMFKVL